MDKEPPLWDYQYRYILYICFVLLLLFLMASLVLAQKPPRTQSGGSESLSDCFIEGPRIPYIPQVETYGALIEDLVECESGGNPDALGDNGRAHGVLQFHRPTFEQYAPLAGVINPDIWNEEQQRRTANYMISIGEICQWTCARIIGIDCP